MDDVVADFKGYARKVLRKEPDNGYRYPENEWRRLKDNPRIYHDLQIKDGAEDLVKWCHEWCIRNNDRLFFLTALPRNNDIPWAIWDKVHWAKKNFPGIPVHFGPYSGDKWKHCKPNDLLIDDRGSNCKEWEAAGGISFQYKNWPECKEWLETTFKPNYKY